MYLKKQYFQIVESFFYLLKECLVALLTSVVQNALFTINYLMDIFLDIFDNLFKIKINSFSVIKIIKYVYYGSQSLKIIIEKYKIDVFSDLVFIIHT